MKSCHVKNIVIGEGIPKICVSLISNSLKELLEEVEEVKKYSVDIIEWRMDMYTDIKTPSLVLEALKEIRFVIPEIPLLCTFRTIAEGGNTPLAPNEYVNLITTILNSKYPDIVDIELSQRRDTIKPFVKLAKEKDIKILLSNHEFTSSLTKKEIIRRFNIMHSLGADIAKIAVLPQSTRDVLTLLDSSWTCHEQEFEIPVVTIAMGEKGFISRITGEIFGSSITFGSVKGASAPGQIPVKELKKYLNDFHEKETIKGT